MRQIILVLNICGRLLSQTDLLTIRHVVQVAAAATFLKDGGTRHFNFNGFDLPGHKHLRFFLKMF